MSGVCVRVFMRRAQKCKGVNYIKLSGGKRPELWYSGHQKLAASQQLVQSISLLLFMLSFIQIRWGGDRGRLANSLGTQARWRIPALQSVRSWLIILIYFCYEKVPCLTRTKKKFNSFLNCRNLNDWKHTFHLSLSSGLTLSPGWSERCAPTSASAGFSSAVRVTQMSGPGPSGALVPQSMHTETIFCGHRMHAGLHRL